MSEKANANQRFTDNAYAADQARSSLERRLKTTADALRVAEERVRTLESNLDRADRDDKLEGCTEAPSTPAAAILAIDRARAATHSKKSSTLPAIPEEEICQFRDATKEGMGALLEAAKAEADSLRVELGRTREAERVAVDAAVKERGVAEQRAAELERAIEHAEHEREQTRSLADARLQKLGQALEQKEREGGVQVRQSAP